MPSQDRDHLPTMPDDERERISSVLRQIGGKNVTWGSQAHLEVWMAEHKMRAERQAANRLSAATWVLAGATLVLAGATVALVFATLGLE